MGRSLVRLPFWRSHDGSLREGMGSIIRGWRILRHKHKLVPRRVSVFVCGDSEDKARPENPKERQDRLAELRAELKCRMSHRISQLMFWNRSLLSSIPSSIHYALLRSFSCRIPYLALGGSFVSKEYAGSDSREISHTRSETIPYHLQLSCLHLFGHEVEWRTQLQFAVS